METDTHKIEPTGGRCGKYLENVAHTNHDKRQSHRGSKGIFVGDLAEKRRNQNAADRTRSTDHCNNGKIKRQLLANVRSGKGSGKSGRDIPKYSDSDNFNKCLVFDHSADNLTDGSTASSLVIVLFAGNQESYRMDRHHEDQSGHTNHVVRTGRKSVCISEGVSHNTENQANTNTARKGDHLLQSSKPTAVFILHRAHHPGDLYGGNGIADNVTRKEQNQNQSGLDCGRKVKYREQIQ